MSYSFTSAANAAVQSVKSGESLWGNLAGFVGEYVAMGGNESKPDVDEVKEVLLNNELAFAKEHPKTPALKTITAYRTAKSVVLKAVEVGVELLDSKGKVKGKTAIETEIKAMAGDTTKTEMEKFRHVLTTATAIGDKLDSEMDLLNAMQLVKELNDKLYVSYKALHKEAA